MGGTSPLPTSSSFNSLSRPDYSAVDLADGDAAPVEYSTKKKGGSSGLVRVAFVVLALVGAGVVLSRGEHVGALLRTTPVEVVPSHPILPLLAQAEQQWTSLLRSQSTTFDRASKTYKQRYSLPPPPGFDKWFAFATQARNHSLIDEYDQLMDDLSPYRSLSPTELRRRTAELAQVPGISIVSIRNGVAQVHSKSGRWAPALAFQQMLASFVRDLPDMDVAINEKPEGRVLPRQQRKVIREEYGLDDDDVIATSKPFPLARVKY